MRTRALRRAAILASLVLTFAMGSVSVAAAQHAFTAKGPDSAELIERQKVPGDISKGLYWNGKTVTFRGEAIGEVMVRGDHAWIHLNDDSYMMKNVEEGAELGGYNSGMAVWVPATVAGQIDTYGDYQHQGSIVEVAGVFNGACAEHGGDTDIHARSLKVLRPGHVVVDPVQPWKAVAAVVLSALAGLVVWLNHRYRTVIAPSRGL